MKIAQRLATATILVVSLIGSYFVPVSTQVEAYSGSILFDAGHGETAGNADWVITGGYSQWASDLRADGYTVSSTTSTITSTLLSGYDVFVLPEPNINLTSSEKTAITNFIANGGGVYFIADHANSDRNNDGWDSVTIFNGYKWGAYNSSTDWVGKTFGFSFNNKTLTQAPITNIPQNSLTSGISAIGAWGGTTIKVTNTSIIKDAYLSGQADPYHIHGTYGSGRFAALGDSSPYDDGTGASGDNLHPNYYDYDDAQLGIQAIEWLTKDR